MKKLDQTELRRQILEDVLGDSVDEYENFTKDDAENKRQHRQRIPLWKFLLHLLNRDQNQQYIQWNKDFELEFLIKDTVGVAELWGSVKNKTDMTYEKLGRAMRYYYGKSIIEKVAGRRYSYRFILSRKTKKYLSLFFNVDEMEVMSAPDSDQEEDKNVFKEKSNETKRKVKKHSNMYKNALASRQMPRLIKPDIASTKTKIFRPNESILQSLSKSHTQDLFSNENQNKIHFHDEIKRPSAFVVPPLLEQTMPSLPNTVQQLNVNKRKRHYPFVKERKAIAYCCCGLHNCKIKFIDSLSDNASECDSLGSSSSPLDTHLQSLSDRSQHSYIPTELNEDFISRRDWKGCRDREDNQILRLKTNLNMNIDPFMGYNKSIQAIDDFFSDNYLLKSKIGEMENLL